MRLSYSSAASLTPMSALTELSNVRAVQNRSTCSLTIPDSHHRVIPCVTGPRGASCYHRDSHCHQLLLCLEVKFSGRCPLVSISSSSGLSAPLNNSSHASILFSTSPPGSEHGVSHRRKSSLPGLCQVGTDPVSGLVV